MYALILAACALASPDPGICIVQGCTAYLHGITSSRIDSPPDRVEIAGVDATGIALGCFRTRTGTYAYCIRAELPSPPATRTFDASASWPGRGTAPFRGRVADRWFLGRTQYEFPLRVVSCRATPAGATLSLYNESNAEKPDLEILKVLVGGRDVTEACRLPDGPLPADRHQYTADEREIEIPLTWPASGGVLTTIEYRLGAPRYPRPGSAPDVSRRSLTVELRRGVPLPIGVSEGADLPGHICLHHGGLRPDPTPAEFARLRDAVRREAGSIPAYVRLAEGIPATDARPLCEGVDLAVVAPPLLVPIGSTMRTSDPEEIRWILADGMPPFVASLYAAKLDRFDDRDLRWWALAMLGLGSRGLEWTDVPGVDRARMTAWLEAQRAWLARGRRVALPVSADQPGILTDAWVCGPDEVAVFVRNAWCSLAPGQVRKPFAAIERRGVRITAVLGPGSPAPVAEWDDGRPVAASVSGSPEGQVVLDLPAFEVGGLIRLRTRAEPRTDRIARSAQPRALEPADLPFHDLGQVQQGARVPVKLRVANRSDRPLAIRVTPVMEGPGAIRPVEFLPTKVAARSVAVVDGTWSPPASSGDVSTAVRVEPEGGRAEDGYIAHLECEVIQKFDTDPPVVNFGRVAVGSAPVDREASLRWGRSPARIAGVTIEPPDPRLSVRFGPNGSLRLRLDPSEVGPIRSSAAVTLGEPDASGTFQVSLLGEAESPIRVSPARVVNATRATVRRVLLVESAEPIEVRAVPPLPPGVAVEEAPSGWARSHRLTILCQPKDAISRDEATSKSSLVLECRTRSGGSSRREIPISRVSVRTTSSTAVAKGEAAGDLDATIAKVDRIVSAFRACRLPDDCPSWVLTHTLLAFPAAKHRTPEQDAEIRRRLGLLLRLADADGRHGCLALYRGKPEFFKGGRLFDHQHHPAQFLHYFAMSEIPLSTPLNVPGKSWTLADIRDGWIRSLRPTGDLSWVSSALLDYHTPGEPWLDVYGKPQRIGTFVNALLENPELYCDQSHWMTSLSRIRADRRWRSEPSLAGAWGRIDELVTGKIRELKAGQGPDGRFPVLPELMKADYRVTQPGGVEEQIIHYSGHHLEWLSIALDGDALREEWILRAVGRIATAIDARYPGADYIGRMETDEACFNAGFLSHAVSGLSRWREAVSARASRREGGGEPVPGRP